MNPNDIERELMIVQGLCKSFGSQAACRDVSFEIFPGEVLGVVGESGSGKSTLLNCIAGNTPPTAGKVYYRRNGDLLSFFDLSEADRRALRKTDIGMVYQNPRDGLRMHISAGGNIGETLMACGNRNYADIRSQALAWLKRVEIDEERIDDRPTTFSGGMLQRLQIARNLVVNPRLVFMDEPTSGLDVSVQARLLDILKGLVETLSLAAVIVTHDLGVARLLAHRLMVMKNGEIVESGLTDQVLDDPQHPYTQLLVSSILQT